MSESQKVYENQPRCADGCIPYDSCEPKTSQNNKEYRKCWKCDNFVNPPKKDRCPDDSCDKWADAAATEFTSKAGVIFRKCLKCDNFVFNDADKSKKYKRSASAMTPAVVSSSSSRDDTQKFDNLNARLLHVETAVAQLAESVSTLTKFLPSN